MFRNNSPPIEPRRREAPITATVRGSKNGRSDAVTAAWSRSSTRSRYRSVGAIGNCDLDLAALQLPCQLEAHRLEDAEHVAVLRHHLCDKTLDTGLRRTVGQPLEEARPDSTPLVGVGDGERGFRDGRVAKPNVVCDGDDLLAGVRAQGTEQSAPLDPVRLEQGLHEPGPERREAVEAEISAPLGERAEELEERVRVVPPRRSQPERATVPEDDVDWVSGYRHQCRV